MASFATNWTTNGLEYTAVSPYPARPDNSVFHQRLHLQDNRKGGLVSFPEGIVKG